MNIETLRNQIEKLRESLPRDDDAPWPPEEGSVDYALWQGAGRPELPDERPEEGPLLYLLRLAAKTAWIDE